MVEAHLCSPAGVLQVALAPEEHLEQAHEQHEGSAAARRGERRPRLRHGTVARYGHLEEVKPF